MEDLNISIPFKTILDEMADGVIVHNAAGRIVYANNFAAKLIGINSSETLINHQGVKLLENYDMYDELGNPCLISQLPSVLTLRDLRPNEMIIKFKHKITGQERWAVLKASPVFNEDSNPVLVVNIFREITEQKENEAQINFHATHDILTGLYNRKTFDDKLSDALKLSLSDGSRLAVLFMDMDRLKDINDTLGHEIGDIVLKETSLRLSDVLGPHDLIARWGGDEFVVLLTHIETMAEVRRTVKKLLTTASPPIRAGKHPLHATVSIGCAVFPEDGQDPYSLLKNADAALYQAKKEGKNRFVIYRRSINKELPERLVMGNELRTALKNNEFELYYQPILDLKTNTVVSAEALLRWNHPRLGYLKPGIFISLSEEIGLIESLGRWVLKSACQTLKQWEEMGLGLNIAVNVSPRQFANGKLAEEIISHLRQSGCDSECLEIEITESLAMDNLTQTAGILSKLSDNGIGVIIDDFGTGYSSLSYLKKFPLKKIKIDKSFVHHIITDEQDTSIVKAIISMAESLRLKVVAEGVDTQQQLALLASLNCSEAQGHYISPPLKADKFLAWIKNNKNA